MKIYQFNLSPRFPYRLHSTSLHIMNGIIHHLFFFRHEKKPVKNRLFK